VNVKLHFLKLYHVLLCRVGGHCLSGSVCVNKFCTKHLGCLLPTPIKSVSVGRMYSSVCYLSVCLSAEQLTRRMAIANETCVSFCNQPKAHFGLPWARPWDNRGKCYMNRKRIQCWSNA